MLPAGAGGADHRLRQTCGDKDDAPAADVVWSSMRAQAIRIIGIDPGLRRTGWGIVEADGGRLTYVASGLVTSDPEGNLAYRLRQLSEGLVGIIARFQPEEAAIEETFVNKDARATLKLGQARGMALLAPALAGMGVAEYPPNVVKKTVTGTGHGDKQQIAAMVGFLLPKATFESADEADALAIAICHASHRQTALAIARSTRVAAAP
jgi:crossover junction endodeoxyribonuclease RuvC